VGETVVQVEKNDLLAYQAAAAAAADAPDTR